MTQFREIKNPIFHSIVRQDKVFFLFILCLSIHMEKKKKNESVGLGPAAFMVTMALFKNQSAQSLFVVRD